MQFTKEYNFCVVCFYVYRDNNYEIYISDVNKKFLISIEIF